MEESANTKQRQKSWRGDLMMENWCSEMENGLKLQLRTIFCCISWGLSLEPARVDVSSCETWSWPAGRPLLRWRRRVEGRGGRRAQR